MERAVRSDRRRLCDVVERQREGLVTRGFCPVRLNVPEMVVLEVP